MVVEFLGGPWDGQVERVDYQSGTIGVPMPPDVDNKPSHKPRDYSRIGQYRIRMGVLRKDQKIRFADWEGES